MKKKIAFLGEIGTEPTDSFWSVEITLNDSSVRFQIDTGADVSVIPERIYKTLQPPPSFTKSSETLFGPAETILPVRGCFIGTVLREDKASQQEIFVTGARQALLG